MFSHKLIPYHGSPTLMIKLLLLGKNIHPDPRPQTHGHKCDICLKPITNTKNLFYAKSGCSIFFHNEPNYKVKYIYQAAKLHVHEILSF